MLASRLDRYGKLTELSLRSREKTIHAELLLEGEAEPVTIRVERYRIVRQGSDYALVIENVTASRMWLENLLQDLLLDKPLPVPPVVLLALGKVED